MLLENTCLGLGEISPTAFLGTHPNFLLLSWTRRTLDYSNYSKKYSTDASFGQVSLGKICVIHWPLGSFCWNDCACPMKMWKKVSGFDFHYCNRHIHSCCPYPPLHYRCLLLSTPHPLLTLYEPHTATCRTALPRIISGFATDHTDTQQAYGYNFWLLW